MSTENESCVREACAAMNKLNTTLEKPQTRVTSNEREETNKLLPIVRRCCAEAKKEKNISPLFLASSAGDVEGVQALLQCTLNIVQGESEEVKLFLRESVKARVNKAEKRKFQCTPLHAAAQGGHTEIVSLLLSNKANPNVMNESECAPIHFATNYGHTLVVSLLIAHGADIEAKNEFQITPLHNASDQALTDIVSLLIKNKANTEAKSGIQMDQGTALHIAVANGHTETVSLLLSLNANIEAKDDYGCTALHYAASGTRTEILNLLISHEANISAKNVNGESPFNSTTNEEIKSLLRKAMKSRIKKSLLHVSRKHL